MQLVILLLANIIHSVTAQVAPDLSVGVLPELFVHGEHYSVGQQIGYATKDSIKYQLQHSSSVIDLVNWTLYDPNGADAYNAMLATANTTFPEYIQELEGMAYGSGADFRTLFCLNVRNELKSFQNKQISVRKGRHGDVDNGSGHGIEHCSDYLMNNINGVISGNNGDGVREIVIGHNEDGGWESRDESALITVHIEGERVREPIRFTAFVYAGELATDAFFWNEHGLIGTMNGLYPVNCLYGGLGRNFVSRNLVGATNIDDAVARVTIPNQATGHSFNFASLYEVRLINVEVAPGTDKETPFVITNITPIDPLSKDKREGTLFHANSYMFMEVEEDPSDSSAHRLARAAELPAPDSVADILVVMGDTEDEEWPIYRTAKAEDGTDTDGDTGYTLVTAVFQVKFEKTVDSSSSSSVTLIMQNPKTNADVNITMPIAVQR